MSLCYRFKRFWSLLFGEFWIERGNRNSSTCRKSEEIGHAGQIELKRIGKEILGAEHSCRDADDRCFESHGINFSSQEEKDRFDTKMEEMQIIFLKELSEIKRQHERLKVGRVILKRRFSELEQILQTDIRNFTSTDIKTFKEDSSLSSEELQLLAEMEEILEKLEKEQEELLSLEKYLEIELHERTFYPEPVMPRHRKVEDEFSKRMKLDGGLKYKSYDETVQLITHRCLPPPLSLDELMNTGHR